MRCGKGSIWASARLALVAFSLFATGTQALAQQEIILHDFGIPFNSSDGKWPAAGLIFDASGSLYGTTSTSTNYPNGGAVFELTPTGGVWKERVLQIVGKSGINAGVTMDATGNLFGTDLTGGAYHRGAAFELMPGARKKWTLEVLYSFRGKNSVAPWANLIFDAAGNLYGTTQLGGTHGLGTVFELTPKAGGWTQKVLHSFTGGKDGQWPAGGLIFDARGNLYSTTSSGGAHNLGTVFELIPKAGGAWGQKVLHSFGFNNHDGAQPVAGVIFDISGNLYGTTQLGGVHGLGTVFEMTPKTGGGWTEKVLHSFGNESDGQMPLAGLVFDSSGNLCGTTIEGGSHDLGTVFELLPKTGGGWTEKLLHSFGDGTDGQYPMAGLILDTAGNLYGTTSRGGLEGYGTVFEITP